MLTQLEDLSTSYIVIKNRFLERIITFSLDSAKILIGLSIATIKIFKSLMFLAQNKDSSKSTEIPLA